MFGLAELSGTRGALNSLNLKKTQNLRSQSQVKSSFFQILSIFQILTPASHLTLLNQQM